MDDTDPTWASDDPGSEPSGADESEPTDSSPKDQSLSDTEGELDSFLGSDTPGETLTLDQRLERHSKGD